MKEMLEKRSELRLLYVTPEKCSKCKQFMAKLQKMYQMGRLDRIAIGDREQNKNLLHVSLSQAST